MLEEMVVAVCKARLLPLEEVRSWYWRKLLRTHRQVGKNQWDEWVAQTQSAQIGTARAIASTFGKGSLPDLPEYDTVAHDPFTPPKKKKLSERWRKYHLANNIPIPDGYE